MLLLSQQVVAAEWSITPSLNLKETYSDNVALAPPGSEMSDWISEIDPGVTLTGTGSHLKAHVNYGMQNLFYANESSQNRTYHQLDAGANAELLDKFLFLDGKAAISQQIISLFGPHPADNTNITDNRATVATYSISPYLRHSFDAIASSELRYTHDEVRTRLSGLLNSKGDSALLNLTSGPAFSRLGWGLHYNKQYTDYSNNQPVEYEILSGNLRFPITPKFSLTASNGYEKYNYLAISGRPQGRLWTAGFSWTPTPRTSLEASSGDRFFGKTYSLAARHNSRNTVWNLYYSEDITTTQAQFSVPATLNTHSVLDQLLTPSIPDPVLRGLIVDSFIRQTGLQPTLINSVNYVTNRFFLQKLLQASVAINSAKSTLVLSAFSLSREALTSQTQDSLLLGSSNLSLNDNTKQIGGNALWNWQFAPRTNVNVSTGYAKSRSLTTGITNNNWTIGLGMTRQFRPKINGSVDLRRTQQPLNQLGGSYRENAVVASLLMKF